MINLKWTKSLTNLYWMMTDLYQNCSQMKDGAYEIARNRRYDGYQRALANMV